MRFAKELGHDINDRTFLKAFENNIMSDKGSVPQHIAELLVVLKIKSTTDLVNRLHALLTASIQTQTHYPNTLSVINELKQNYELALITNTFYEGFQGLRQKYPIDNWFKIILLSYEEHVIKPNPKMYGLLMKRTGLMSSELMMVGDNYDDDVLVAEKLGIKAILLDRRNRYPQVKKRKISGLSQIKEYL